MTATIAFDGSVLAAGPITGVGRAFLHTLRAFAEGPEHCVLLLPAAVRATIAAVVGDRVEIRAAAGTALEKQFTWPRLLRDLQADLLHAPVAAIPLRLPCPAVITVHDLPWRSVTPLPRGDGQGLRHRAAIRLLAPRAAAIVVPSHTTASALCAELRADVRARVHVVPHGVPSLSPLPLAELDGGLLCLGDDRPRKNRAAVGLAHARARDVPPLRFVGPPGDYLPEDGKTALLRRARGLVHFALHEGFGMPVLEAMAAGVPVACSDRGSLAELGADGAALLADPTDIAAMTAAIERLCHDGDLRVRLRAAGLARAATLTPARAAASWRAIHARVRRGGNAEHNLTADGAPRATP